MSSNTDIIESYSFCIFLNIHFNFYNYLLNTNLNIFKCILFAFLGNAFFSFTFKFNLIDLIFHKYWKNNFKTIAFPQLINSCGTILIHDVSITTEYFNNFIMKCLCLFILNYSINKYCILELRRSKILRLNYYLLYFILWPIFF